MAETDEAKRGDTDQPSRPVPRLVILGPEDEPSVLAGFPGRFIVRHCSTTDDLDSILLTGRVDLLILDCRFGIPNPMLLDLVREERVADFLAVGLPEGKKSVPSWMRSHWCPWPVDRKSFYRLIVALSRKAYWARAYREQKRGMAHLQEEAALGRHLAQVLHELNNPLDAVTRFVDLAGSESINEVAKDHLTDAASGLKRMRDALAALHRRSQDSASILRSESLREVIRDAAAASGLVSGHFDLEVHGGLEDHRVPQALLPILINLMKNAASACDERGTISVDIRTRPGLLIIAVTDDGEGFGELFAEELFKPWFSMKNEDEGLGLGLYAARNAVEQLGGQLRANSDGIGRGATFTITLPIALLEHDQGGAS